MMCPTILFASVRTRCAAPKRGGRLRGGFTLVEMLVAMALSLIIVLAVTQVFRLVGDNVLAGRAVQEMSGQLRATASQLQRDLEGLSVSVRPWAESSVGQGYFEAYEGPFWDLGLGAVRYTESSAGDIDDIMMFTTRATGAPFTGQVMASLDLTDPANVRLYIDPANPLNRITIESRVAEVVWFTRFNDWNRNTQPDPGEVTLHRRVLLVLPNLDLSDPTIQAMSPLQFYSNFDVSVRTTQLSPNSWVRVANSLEDLSKRENRIVHDVSGAYPSLTTPNRTFPSVLSRALLAPQGSVVTVGADGDWGVSGVDDDGNGAIDDIADAGQFGSDDLAQPIDAALPPLPPISPTMPGPAAFAEPFGSDVILSNVLAFDVKVFDPMAKVQRAVGGTDPVLPGDPGYRALLDTDPDVIGSGGFVDLFYGRYVPGVAASVFSGPPSNRSGLFPPIAPPVVWGAGPPASLPSTYDTWTGFYEHDGVDQDGVGGVDQGTNGFDDDATNGVDDVAERETSPPYAVPLRGVQIRIRIIDRDTRQVRQMTVSSNFVPE